MAMSSIPQERVIPSTLYPDGWFVLCFASELKSKAVKTVEFMGEELVLYRTESGAVIAVEPHCPHLGAHLGRGGKIVGETIVCPFHHFAFATDGHCLPTPDGVKPPQARLTHRHVQEWNGLIFVWQGPDIPRTIWKLPNLDLLGFTTPLRSHHNAWGNLQNIGENVFDLNHFAPVHGWLKAVIQPPIAEGHQLTAQYTMEVLGLAIQMKMRLFGLGLTIVEVTQKRLGLHIILMVTPTQISPQQWALKDFMVLRVERLSIFPRWIRNTLNLGLTAAAYHFWFIPEAKKDLHIWACRNYGAKPKLAANEGPIMIFRNWAAQFYPPHESPPEKQTLTETLIATTRDLQT
ncbi:Rieske 2Fe-2S domain-containing protein [Pseudomonas salmasensis]|uniref:cholesterol 7-desaturase n=1 Tax=Pseudomonas salmasensis TaxID=2745514 RepID=A0ABU5FEN3_9PSED|nr:Rieske 2Fe-2S domain-containing protein [Pseudomonas salmasensis]MDY4300631.1 Rieske 2Fe-2S domain-containing protein [Pseudomonas salmasensis]